MSPVSSTQTNPWSQEEWKATLTQLRLDYPGYSDNELYVIWCHVNGHVPFDKNGKINQEQWQIHAEEDGQHTPAGSFKVSRPLYGRALKAVAGQPKPKNAARGSKKKGHVIREQPIDPFTSSKALQFAKSFDSASRILATLIEKQREAQQVAEQLRQFPKGVLMELAGESEEAKEVLRVIG